MTTDRKIILPEHFDVPDTEWASHLLSGRPHTKTSSEIYGRALLGVVSNVPTPSEPLTVDKIRQALEVLKGELDKYEAPPVVPRIHVSDLAVTASNKPKVIHIRRWYHTKKYHLKKQAQLNAVHGFVVIPAVFYVNPGPQYELGFWSTHHQQPYYVVHPKLYEELKAQIDAHGKANIETLVNKFQERTK